MPEALLWLLLTGDVPTKAQVRERETETETERQAARQGLGWVTSRERERERERSVSTIVRLLDPKIWGRTQQTPTIADRPLAR